MRSKKRFEAKIRSRSVGEQTGARVRVFKSQVLELNAHCSVSCCVVNVEREREISRERGVDGVDDGARDSIRQEKEAPIPKFGKDICRLNCA